MEDVVVIEHCKDCDKHKWCTNHDEKKYKDIYEKTRSQIENECPEVTVLENQDHPSILGIITQKTDRTPFAKLSFPKTGSFEVYFRGKIIFSKLKHGIWPHPAMVAKNIRDIIDGNVEVKVTPQTTGFKEYQSKPEVPKRPKAAAPDKQETAEKKLASSDNFAKGSSPSQPSKLNKPEEKKAEPAKPQVEEKKAAEVAQVKTVEVSKVVKEEKKEEVKENKLQAEGSKAADVQKLSEKGHEDGTKAGVEPPKATVEVTKHEESSKAHVEAPKAPAEGSKHEEPPKAPVEVAKHHDEPPKAAVEPPKHHEEPPKAAVEPAKHHEEIPKAPVEPPKHHEEPPKAHVEPPKHHEEPPKAHAEPPKHHEELPKAHAEPPKHHEEPPKAHAEPPKHHEEPPKHHEEPPKHHEEPPKHHEEPPKHHEEPPKHHEEPPKHHEEPAKPHEEVHPPNPPAKAEEEEENYEDDEDMQESNTEAPYAVTETFNLPLAVGEGKNSKIALKNTKEAQQVFHIQVKNSSLIKVTQTEYTVDPGVPQKLKLEILPQTKAGVYRGYIIVESEHEVVACNEIVVEVN